MESTAAVLCAPTATPTMLALSKALNRHLANGARSFLLPTQLPTRRVVPSSLYSPQKPLLSSSSVPLRGLCAVVLPLVRQRLGCVSSSSASFGTAAGGGGGGGEGAGGGGWDGDGSSDGGDLKSNLVAGPAEDVSALSPDVIILDVGGMTCGGCAASVKRILENQPKVSSASVNLANETAIVWPVSEAKIAANWKKQLGEALANHLTSCGFKSNLRVAGKGANEGDISS